jgi:hypothetical protein
MTQYRRIGIDTSKAVFTLHALISRNDRSCASTFVARR